MMDKKELFKQITAELKNQRTSDNQDKISENMFNMYGIPEGVTLSLLVREANERFFETTDLRLITLFIMEAFKVLGRGELIGEYIPLAEQNEAKQYDFEAMSKKDIIKLPITFKPVVEVNSVFSSKLSIKEIAELINSDIINYNFDIQREAKMEIRTDKIIKKPTLNQTNIKEMTQLLLNDSLKESTIYLNAAPLTATEGEELLYNSEDYSLTITEGTRLDVLDGFHRILSAQRAYRENPSLDFEFAVVFSNFTTSEAIRWQAQHSKATAWSQNRVAEMQQESKSAKVVKAIKDSDAELERTIYTGKSTTVLGRDNLITFTTLTKAIDEMFTLKNRRDEVELAEELSQILMSLQDIKRNNSSFHSQLLVVEFISQYVHQFNRNLEHFLNYLDEVNQFLSRFQFSFVLGSSNSKEARKLADKKVQELYTEVHSQVMTGIPKSKE